MSSSRHTFFLTRSDSREPSLGESSSSLAARLEDVAADRISCSADVVRAACAVLEAWVLEQPEAWSWERAGLDLEAGLRDFVELQGWRAPCSLWVDSLRRAWHGGYALARLSDELGARDLLVQELAHWRASSASVFARSAGAFARSAGALARSAGDGREAAWNGEPLAAGRRLPSRADLAEHAAAPMEHGEVVLVTAHSLTLALALQAAQRAGKRPHALVAEAWPSLEGRRMAAILARVGIPVTLCRDAAMPSNLPRADRVWLSTEAIGSDALLAHIGTRLLVEEAERVEVPVHVLATSDKLMPGGELVLPGADANRATGADARRATGDDAKRATGDDAKRATGAGQDRGAITSAPRGAGVREHVTDLAWLDAPEGVRQESQTYEAVSLDALPSFVTEIGAETATALHLRALRIETAAPCASRTST